MKLRRRTLRAVLCAGGALALLPASAAGAYEVRFTKPEQRAYDGARAVAVGPVVGADRRPDVVVASSETVRVYPQRADGRLDAPRTWPLPGTVYPWRYNAVDTGDLNGDGRRDVAVVVGRGLAVLYGSGTTLAPPILLEEAGGGLDLALADLDGDGRLDVVVGGNGVVVLWNEPGGFRRAVVTAPAQHDVEVADVTGDGLPDIVGCDDWVCKAVLVFEARGDGTFERRDYPVDFPNDQCSSVRALATGDVDGDGRQDVVAMGTGCSEVVFPFLQTEAGTLRQNGWYAMRAQLPGSIATGDMNGDGRTDVVVLHGSDDFRPVSRLGLHLQTAEGTLAPVRLFDFPETSHYQHPALALASVDGDARLDVIAAGTWRGLIVRRQRLAPRARLRSASPQRLASVRARGIRLSARCDKPCVLRLELRLTKRAAQRLGVKRRVLGRTAVPLRANRWTAVQLGLNRTGRRQLANVRRAGFAVSGRATDPAGTGRALAARVAARR